MIIAGSPRSRGEEAARDLAWGQKLAQATISASRRRAAVSIAAMASFSM